VKKLRVTVNGVSYDVQVEVLEDDGISAAPVAAPAARPTPPPAPAPAAAPAAPAQAAAPAPVSTTPGSQSLESPIAGIVVEIKAQVGDSVNKGDPVIVVEAMKMNTNVNAPVSGTVASVNVKAGDAVKAKQVLMTFA
jgi:biotin carboxyl carrier protein